MVMFRDFYGLNIIGAAWRKMFAETLRDKDFVLTVADTDIYHGQSRRPNGEDYCKLLLVYVDDIICLLKNHQLTMDTLVLMYYVKGGLVGPPKIYLGVDINKYQGMSGKYHWIMSSTQYIKNSINTV